MSRPRFSRRTFPLVLMALALAMSVRAQETTPSEDLALQAYRKGEVERAVALYTTALSETADANHRARIQVQIAWNLFSIGRLDEVRTHLRAALVEDPSLSLLSDYYTPEFLEIFESSRRSNLEHGGGTPPPDLEVTIAAVNDRIAAGADLEGALADVDRLLAAYPRDGRLLPLKAQLLTLLGRTEEANALSAAHAGAEGALYADAVSATDLVLRANRLLEQGDATTALQLTRQAVTLSPNNYMALELMAEAAQRVADWKSAEYALKTALALQPDNIDLKLRLGETFVATFEASAARDIFKSLTEKFPHSDRAWASLGLLEARLGNHDRALDALGRAIAENALLPEVQLAHGELLLLKGEVDGALRSFEAAANLLRTDPQLEARRGQALLAKGRSAEALPRLRAAVAGGFEKPDVQRALALALALEGLHAESERVIAAVEQDAAGDRELVTGFLALERRDYAAAERTLAVLAESRRDVATMVNLLAAAVYPQARYAEAVRLLERAHGLAPQTGIVADNLAKARAALAAEQLGAVARLTRALPE
ncbi:MAG: tetratricopeptide repeat protein [Thermoanaerobaculales bacterium]|nr:tetratricopeptide repeat protein [Thermoanaerobaculales bacterium]